MCVVGEGVEEHKITINCEILFFSGQRQHKTTVSVYSGLVLAKYIYENPVCLNSH